MGIETAIAAAAVAASVGGTVYSMDQSKKAQENQNKAARQERAMNEIENARKRRIAIAQRRIQVGQINNAAAVANATGASGPVGARGAIVGDTGTGLANFESRIASRNNQLSFLEAASENQANAQLGSTIAQLGAQLGGTDLSFLKGSGEKGGSTSNTPSPGYSIPSTNTYPTGITFSGG